MDAAILIVIVDSGCKFHGGVIWPQRHFSLHALPSRRTLPSNELRDGSPSHLKFDRVRATTKKFGGDVCCRRFYDVLPLHSTQRIPSDLGAIR